MAHIRTVPPRSHMRCMATLGSCAVVPPWVPPWVPLQSDSATLSGCCWKDWGATSLRVAQSKPPLPATGVGPARQGQGCCLADGGRGPGPGSAAGMAHGTRKVCSEPAVRAHSWPTHCPGPPYPPPPAPPHTPTQPQNARAISCMPRSVLSTPEAAHGLAAQPRRSVHTLCTHQSKSNAAAPGGPQKPMAGSS